MSTEQEKPTCECGHSENDHETVEYRGDKRRHCLVEGCFCRRFAAPPAGAQGETRAEFEADRMGETGARLREASQAEEIARLRAEREGARESLSAECARTAGVLVKLDAALSQVQALQAQLDGMVAPEERDQWKREAQLAQQRIETLEHELTRLIQEDQP